MKLAAVLLVAAVMTPCLAAAQPVAGPYVGVGGGVNFLQDEIVHPVNRFGPAPRSYSFDAGGAAAVSVGYGLGNGIRLEIEGDYASNHVSGVRIAFPLQAGGHEQQFGGFFNALYDFRLSLPVVPYVGIGAGYQEVELDGIASYYPGARLGRPRVADEGNFAYQAIAGLSYPIGRMPGLSLTAEYRFIGVLAPASFDRGFVIAEDGSRQASRATFNNIFNHEILFGLRYAFDAALRPRPRLSASPAAPAPASARSYVVFFDWDRAELTDRARQIIAEAAQASTRVQTTRVEVDGYTDRSGTVAYNQGLSLRRARAVAAELVRTGVPRGAISIQGLGEDDPLVATADGMREAQNRRVQIILR